MPPPRSDTGVPPPPLATAKLAGWTVPRHPEAIAYAAEWLLHWRHQDGTWLPAVTGTELDTNTTPTGRGRADAWCYGTPSITHALRQAGHALNRPDLCATADSALDTMAARDPETWDVEGPTLCHGYAGILQSAPATHPIAKIAAEALTSTFDPAHPFGFQHLHHGQPHDNPGLLTGATGIALTLADHQQLPAPNAPASWDSLLNLS